MVRQWLGRSLLFVHFVEIFTNFPKIFAGMLNSITQESPAPNMTDEGHTMSSDMSGPVRYCSSYSFHLHQKLFISIQTHRLSFFSLIHCEHRLTQFRILIRQQFVICSN